MEPSKILKDAETAPDKRGLEVHREAVLILRQKDYSWREIAGFLTERGVQTDHTKVYRMFNKAKENEDDHDPSSSGVQACIVRNRNQ